MSRARDEDMDGVEVPLELRGAFENPIELARLRHNAFESVGRPYADGILYGIGLSRGLLDGLRGCSAIRTPVPLGSCRARGLCGSSKLLT